MSFLLQGFFGPRAQEGEEERLLVGQDPIVLGEDIENSSNALRRSHKSPELLGDEVSKAEKSTYKVQDFSGVCELYFSECHKCFLLRQHQT